MAAFNILGTKRVRHTSKICRCNFVLARIRGGVALVVVVCRDVTSTVVGVGVDTTCDGDVGNVRFRINEYLKWIFTFGYYSDSAPVGFCPRMILTATTAARYVCSPPWSSSSWVGGWLYGWFHYNKLIFARVSHVARRICVILWHVNCNVSVGTLYMALSNSNVALH